MFNQKGLIPILVLLVVILLAGFVIYQKQTTSPAPKPSEQPNIVDETVYTEALRSANWKTYASKNFNYSIKYPENWETYAYSFKPEDEPKDFLGERFFRPIGTGQLTPPINIKIGFTEGYAYQYQQNLLKDNVGSRKVVIDGVEGIIVPGSGAQFVNKDYVYEIFSSISDNSTFNQMLSTLKFTDSNAQNHVLLPKQDLAKRLAVKEEEITVVSVEETEWSDSSLGCPKEGQFYAQVITPGYKVILSYNHPLAEFQKTYQYHTDKAGNFVLCEP